MVFNFNSWRRQKAASVVLLNRNVDVRSRCFTAQCWNVYVVCSFHFISAAKLNATLCWDLYDGKWAGAWNQQRWSCQVSSPKDSLLERVQLLWTREVTVLSYSHLFFVICDMFVYVLVILCQYQKEHWLHCNMFYLVLVLVHGCRIQSH